MDTETKQVDLFEAGAEVRALETGLPLSQALAEVRCPNPVVLDYGLFAPGASCALIPSRDSLG